MGIFSSLRNLNKSLEKAKIIIDLELYLIRKDVRTSMGDALLFSLKQKVSPDIIIASIKSDIEDGNPKNVAEVIGENLMLRIKNYK